MEAKELEDLYRLYFKDVYYYALSLSKSESTAQDLVSETYLKAFQYLPEEHVNVRAWLFQVCHNLFVDEQRKVQRRKKYFYDKLPFFNVKEDPKVAQDQAVQKTIIESAMMKLPLPYREVLFQFYLAQRSIQEISQLLLLSEENVKIRLHRGRKLLRKEMEENEHEG